MAPRSDLALADQVVDERARERRQDFVEQRACRALRRARCAARAGRERVRREAVGLDGRKRRRAELQQHLEGTRRVRLVRGEGRGVSD